MFLLDFKNEGMHKVIIIFGLKIKIKLKRLQQKQELNQQKQELNQQKEKRFGLKKWVEFTLDIGCPNNCEYCPQDVLLKKYYEKDKSRKSTITLDDFKVLLKNIPRDIDINFAGFGEPFRNSQAIDMIDYAIREGHFVHIYSTLFGLTKEQIISFKYMRISSFVVHLPDRDGLLKLNVDDNYLYNLELFYSLGLPNANFMVIGKLHGKVVSIIKESVWAVPIVTRGKNLGKKDTLKQVDSYSNKEIDISQNIKILCNRRFYNKRMIGIAPTHAESSVLLPDGTMVLCCADWNMQHQLGNLYNSTYEEIMNGPIMNRIEGSMMCKNSDKILCRDCEWAVEWDEKKWENFKVQGKYV
jgi:hypothetical protein